MILCVYFYTYLYVNIVSLKNRGYIHFVMKFLQINLDRVRAAHDIAMASTNREYNDLLILSEPKASVAKGPSWITDKLRNGAFLIRNHNI